jgi:hypothetical protein
MYQPINTVYPNPFTIPRQYSCNISATHNVPNPLLVSVQPHAIWDPLLCHMKCSQELPQCLGRLKINFFFCSPCVCITTWCIAVLWASLVCRQIVIAVADVPQLLITNIPSHMLLHLFSYEGQYTNRMIFLNLGTVGLPRRRYKPWPDPDCCIYPFASRL